MTNAAPANGLQTALTMIGAEGHDEAASDEALQEQMFAADAAMPTDLPTLPARSGDKGGRPQGARNKSTEAWRHLFLSKFRHPLMGLGEMTTRTPEQLARELGLYKFHEGKQVVAPMLDENGVHLHDAYGNPRFEPVLATGEAAQMIQQARIAMLPYLAQKLPIAIETKGDKRGLLVIGDLTVNSTHIQGDQLPLADHPPPEPRDITPSRSE